MWSASFVSDNLLHHLRARESSWKYEKYSHSVQPVLVYERNFYRSITPKLTVQNVDSINGFMRCFTPDGSMLLSFSHDQRALQLWTYQGVRQVLNMTNYETKECIEASDQSDAAIHARQNIFHSMFKKRKEIRLAVDNYARSHLHREFSIFIDNGKYVLLASMFFNENITPFTYYINYPDLTDNLDLFSYTFFLVDLQTAQLSDVIHYEQESININNNHSVSVFGKTIAILSRLRQCIELRELVDGKLVPLFEVGPRSLASLTLYLPSQDTIDIFTMLPYSHLKQRILAYLYREIMEISVKEERYKELRIFYRTFRIYERMVIDKMQLIDNDHLLIRFEQRPEPATPSHVEIKDFKLFVFYAISTEEVLKIYKKDSEDLLNILRAHCDQLRNVRSQYTQRPPSSPGNNTYFRSSFDAATESLPGRRTEAAIRFNPTMPVSSQSFVSNIYLDYSYFVYDDRAISSLERPKPTIMGPIVFRDRVSNSIKFRLLLERRQESDASAANTYISGSHYISNRELVAFIFHPFEPFVISIQKLDSRYIVNFHLYNENTIVQRQPKRRIVPW